MRFQACWDRGAHDLVEKQDLYIVAVSDFHLNLSLHVQQMLLMYSLDIDCGWKHNPRGINSGIVRLLRNHPIDAASESHSIRCLFLFLLGRRGTIPQPSH